MEEYLLKKCLIMEQELFVLRNEIYLKDQIIKWLMTTNTWLFSLGTLFYNRHLDMSSIMLNKKLLEIPRFLLKFFLEKLDFFQKEQANFFKKINIEPDNTKLDELKTNIVGDFNLIFFEEFKRLNEILEKIESVSINVFTSNFKDDLSFLKNIDQAEIDKIDKIFKDNNYDKFDLKKLIFYLECSELNYNFSKELFSMIPLNVNAMTNKNRSFETYNDIIDFIKGYWKTNLNTLVSDYFFAVNPNQNYYDEWSEPADNFMTASNSRRSSISSLNFGSVTSMAFGANDNIIKEFMDYEYRFFVDPNLRQMDIEWNKFFLDNLVDNLKIQENYSLLKQAINTNVLYKKYIAIYDKKNAFENLCYNVVEENFILKMIIKQIVFKILHEKKFTVQINMVDPLIVLTNKLK